MKIIFTILGLLVAILVNCFVPGISDEEIITYDFGGLELNMNQAYCLVLALIAVVFVISGIYSRRNEQKKAKYNKKSYFRFAVGIALAVWDITGTKYEILPSPFFPGPAKIIESFLVEGDYIWENTLYSLRLFAVGFLIGVAVGVVTGILIGFFPKVNYWVSPVLNVCGVIPAIAWMPFALIMFPTSFWAAVFLIVICTWFPVASMTASGIVGTPKHQIEAAHTLGAKTSYTVFHVALPHALPQIFVGITTAEAFAFTTLVMAEMMGQPGGLGYYINASKVWSAYYKVFAAILVMAVMFSLIKFFIDKLQDHVLKWQKGIVK